LGIFCRFPEAPKAALYFRKVEIGKSCPHNAHASPHLPDWKSMEVLAKGTRKPNNFAQFYQLKKK